MAGAATTPQAADAAQCTLDDIDDGSPAAMPWQLGALGRALDNACVSIPSAALTAKAAVPVSCEPGIGIPAQSRMAPPAIP